MGYKPLHVARGGLRANHMGIHKLLQKYKEVRSIEEDLAWFKPNKADDEVCESTR